MRKPPTATARAFRRHPPFGTTRTTLSDRRAAAVVGHDFRNHEQQQRETGDTAVARFVRSSNAGVAPVTAQPGSDSDLRLQAAADRGASKHFEDSRNRGTAERPMRPSPRYTVDHTTMRTFGEQEV